MDSDKQMSQVGTTAVKGVEQDVPSQQMSINPRNTMSENVLRWQRYLPHAAFISASAFLAASALLGFRRRVAAVENESTVGQRPAAATVSVKTAEAKKVPSTRELFWKPLPNSQLSAGMLATKALLYGTALCFAGAGVTVAVTMYALDVRDVRDLYHECCSAASQLYLQQCTPVVRYSTTLFPHH